MSAAAPESSPSTADPTSKPALFGSAAAPELSPSSGLRQRRATKKEEEDKKISAIIGAAAATPPPPLTVYLKRFEPAINALASALVVVGPVYVRIAELLYSAYHTLPMDLIEALVGLGMCFFGGAYCASIAAVEAFLIVGWDTTSAALLDIYDDVQSIKLAAEADDKKQGGEAEPAFGADRIKQKMRVAALAVRDPEKLTHAVGGVYAGWVVVQGTLRLQFARTITLGISIAKMLDPVLMRFGLPILTHVVPADLHHWLPTLLRTACKMVAVALSWYLQVLISAVQSSIRGGLLFARKSLHWANEHGYIHLTAADSYLDETVGFTFALLGFYTQWQWGFALPFPFNVIMFPFSTIEWYIRWSITSAT
uniref:Uncharacterized protein n=1 Tax=Haptolina ericina TaxID=156174 RepID=A0A7S3AXW1_9EUKA